MTIDALPSLLLGTAGRDRYRVAGDVVDATRPSPVPMVATIAALPQALRFDLHKAAIIVVDMQNDFCSPDGWMATLGADTGSAQALVPSINRVTAGARAAGVPVIWLNWGVRPDRANLPPITRYPFSDRQAFDGLGAPVHGARATAHGLLVKDGWGARIFDMLDVDDGDIQVDKHRISGFWDTPLDSILRTLQVRTLFFAGVNSDHCVLGSLMDASFLGYDTVMLEDGVATSSPDFCHRAAIHNVRFCFGFTTRSEDLAAAFAGATTAG